MKVGDLVQSDITGATGIIILDVPAHLGQLFEVWFVDCPRSVLMSPENLEILNESR
jgi:hypothetical protein|tara:strand:- start:700 stop:867 length:168 start_codon:yes stop_codon:yes gene_type:complete